MVAGEAARIDMRNPLTLAKALFLLPSLAAASYRTDFPLPTVSAADGLGVNLNAPGYQAKYDYTAMKNAGIGWVRILIDWNDVEQQNKFAWTNTDFLMAKFKENRLRAVVVLGFGNTQYTGGRNVPPTTPAQRTAFAKFAAAVASRYAGRGHVWEIWNEPNYKLFWPVPDASSYMALVKSTVQEIRAKTPEEWIAGPGVSGIDVPYLKTCLDQGLLNQVDAVTFHPYRNSDPETILEDITELRRILRRYPKGSTVPLVNSEWGYSLGEKATTEEQQRDFTLRLTLLSVACELPFNLVHAWQDVPATSGDNGRYGLIAPNGLPRQVYNGLRSCNLQLVGFRYAGRLFTGDDRDWVLVFTNGRQEKVIAWSRRSVLATIPFLPNTLVIQRFPANGRSPGVTQRLILPTPNLSISLAGSPVIITPVSRDAGLAALGGLPALPIAQSVGGTSDVTNVLRSWMTAAKRFPVGGSLAVTDVGQDPQDTRSFRGTISGTGNPTAAATPQEAESIAAQLIVVKARDDTTRRLSFEITIPGRPTLRFESSVIPYEPVNFTLLPVLTGDVVRARARLVQTGSLTGQMRLILPGSTSDRNFSVTEAAPSADASFTASTSDLYGGFTLSALSGNANVLQPLTRRLVTAYDYRSLPLGSQSSSTFSLIHVTGQTLSPGNTIRVVTAPVGLPVAGAKAMEVNYDVPTTISGVSVRQFGSALISSSARPSDIVTWVNGDNSGNEVFVIFYDALNRYYQTKRVRVTWSGWREVRWRLDREEDFFAAPTGSTYLPVAPISITSPMNVEVGFSATRRGVIRYTGVTVLSRG